MQETTKEKKTRAINPTIRQRELAKELVKNLKTKEFRTSGKVLEKIGYSKGLQRSPKVVIDTPGVRKALEYEGLSEERTDNVVKEILEDKRIKPDTRLNSANLIYKRLGSYKPEKSLILTAQIDEATKNRLDMLMSGLD